MKRVDLWGRGEHIYIYISRTSLPPPRPPWPMVWLPCGSFSDGGGDEDLGVLRVGFEDFRILFLWFRI